VVRHVQSHAKQILNDSPVAKIAHFGVTLADAALARAKREIISDLSLRAGSNDFEPLGVVSPPTVGLIGFAASWRQLARIQS
jgi:hypothetical protein